MAQNWLTMMDVTPTAEERANMYMSAEQIRQEQQKQQRLLAAANLRPQTTPGTITPGASEADILSVINPEVEKYGAGLSPDATTLNSLRLTQGMQGVPDQQAIQDWRQKQMQAKRQEMTQGAQFGMQPNVIPDRTVMPSLPPAQTAGALAADRELAAQRQALLDNDTKLFDQQIKPLLDLLKQARDSDNPDKREIHFYQQKISDAASKRAAIHDNPAIAAFAETYANIPDVAKKGSDKWSDPYFEEGAGGRKILVKRNLTTNDVKKIDSLGSSGLSGSMGQNVWAGTGIPGVSRNRKTNEYVIRETNQNGEIVNRQISAEDMTKLARGFKEGQSAAGQAGGAKTAALYRADKMFSQLAPKLKKWKSELSKEDKERIMPLVTSSKTINELNNKIESSFRDNPTQALLLKNTVLLADALSTVYGAGPGGQWSFETAKAMLDPMVGEESFTATLDSHGEKIRESLAAGKEFPKSVPTPDKILPKKGKKYTANGEYQGKPSYSPDKGVTIFTLDGKRVK